MHDILKYNVKIIGSDSKSVFDHMTSLLGVMLYHAIKSINP